MDAVELLAALIAQRNCVSASEHLDHSAYNQLMQAGLIEEIGVVSSVICDECSTYHDAAIVYEEGQYGYYCPDLGFIPTTRSELISIQPNLSLIVAQIADQLNCKRRKSAPLSGETRRIGAIDTPAGDIALYFQPTMVDSKDIKDFESALIGEMRSSFGVVLTSAGLLTVPRYVTAHLQDVLRFDTKSGKLTMVADLTAIAGIPEIRSGGRPSIYKEPLTELIASRTNKGTALEGRNEEAKAILADYRTNFPNAQHPSLSIIKRYISKARSGS